MTIRTRLGRLESAEGMRDVRSVRDFTTAQLLALVADIVPSARDAHGLDDVDEG